jgi:MGT family glycosyltransferase
MAKFLAYSIQTPAHTYPFVPVLQELQRRKHAVVFAMFQTEPRSTIGGVRVRRVPAPAAQVHDGARQEVAGRVLAAHYGEPLAQALERLLRDERPDFLLVDPMLWGGMIAAEASGLPWAALSHNPKTIRGIGLDARGPGLPPPRSPLERLRHRLVTTRLRARADRALPVMNAVRATRGLPPLRALWSCYHRAPLTIATTAMPFEYPRADWPASYRFVGPILWEPPVGCPPELRSLGSGPILLLVGSSIEESGRAAAWVETAIEALAAAPYPVVATLPTDWRPKHLPPNVSAYPFVPHTRLLPRAACVVCHGGSGITHKALAAGVPVVAVPFAYDRFEVARRVERAHAGVMLPGSRLTAARLGVAVERAIRMRPGAQRLAESFAAAGGATAAADHIEELLHGPLAARPERAGASVARRVARPVG